VRDGGKERRPENRVRENRNLSERPAGQRQKRRAAVDERRDKNRQCDGGDNRRQVKAMRPEREVGFVQGGAGGDAAQEENTEKIADAVKKPARALVAANPVGRVDGGGNGRSFADDGGPPSGPLLTAEGCHTYARTRRKFGGRGYPAGFSAMPKIVSKRLR
jgi:hypothetical protein